MPQPNQILIEQFRQVLAELEQHFRLCVQDCQASSTAASPQRVFEWLDEIHKSILIKVYVFVAEADQRWSAEEKQLATVLFDYIWPCGDHQQNLREAAGRVFATANNMQWDKLLRPFQEIAVLRPRNTNLESLITRMANIVAKCDGQVSGPEVERLRQIQQVLDQFLRASGADNLNANVGGVQPPRSNIDQRNSPRVPAAGPRNAQPATGGPPTSTRHPSAKQSAPANKASASASASEYAFADVDSLAQSTRSPEELLADELAKLERLVGLKSVKHEIKTLVNFLKLQSERVRAGLPTTKLSLHMVFQGNPGTGKTTVARIVGGILGAMGILSSGHLVETDRSGLVAEYAGQTGVKTNKKVDEALDGVLFIDEAYALSAESDEDPYGDEAVQTLLKRMEDDRSRLVVILAGYSQHMERLIKSNPGLSSRFNTKLVFEDYSPREMGAIFQEMCNEHHYRIPWETRAKFLVAAKIAFDHRDEHFGNARLVRNVFESSVRRLANRIAGVAPLTTELLTTFTSDDIVVDRHQREITSDDLANWRFEVACESCRANNLAPGNLLGRRVKCLKCQHEFSVEWGDPKRSAE